jgi:hypothetical protein
VAGLTGGGADAGAFLTRLTRLDPGALVRLRTTAAGALSLWARLPWEVLVTRQVPAPVEGADDRTVAAAAALSNFPRYRELARRDVDWHWPLPPGAGEVVERIPAGEFRRVGAAAAATLKSAGESGVGGRAVGARVLRDALLDHVPIVVEAGDQRFEVPQRLVQGLLRMGFLGAPEPGADDPPVAVRAAPGWVGVAAAYGSAWRQSVSPFALRRIQ